MIGKKNPLLKSAIWEVVENQLRNSDPPETKTTYDRLIKEGHSDIEARELIGCVVTLKYSMCFKKNNCLIGIDSSPH